MPRLAETVATVTEPAPVASFSDFPIHPDIVDALAEHKITSPFPIQAMTLPVALAGHDIIGQAKTGTGKTLGFGIPILQPGRLAPGTTASPRCRSPASRRPWSSPPPASSPCRSPATSSGAGKKRGVRVLTVYGGRAYEPQVEALQRGVEVVVGTPGRLIDLAKQGHLDLGHARIVVLDEADEMLDLGFLPDVERLLRCTPAVAPDHALLGHDAGRRRRAGPPLHDASPPTSARWATTRRTPTRSRPSSSSSTAPTRWTRSRCSPASCRPASRGLTIIFSRTKRTAAKVADELADRGFAAAAIHGDLGQGAREQALRAFRNGKVDVLVATDVAARGIDVEDVTHVINYQCPEDEKTYLHRIGRTGRAGNTGIAVTFVDWDDLPRWAHDQQGARPGHARAAGDLLLLAAPVLRPRHPRGQQGPPPPRAAAPVRAWAPRCSRTSARPARAPAGAARHAAATVVAAAGAPATAAAAVAATRATPRDRHRARATPPAEGADRPKRNRNRRRTRGGSPSGDATAS